MFKNWLTEFCSNEYAINTQHFPSNRSQHKDKTLLTTQARHGTQHSRAIYFGLCRCNRNSSMHKLIMIHSLKMGKVVVVIVPREYYCTWIAPPVHCIASYLCRLIEIPAIIYTSAQPQTNSLNQQIQVDTATGTRHKTMFNIQSVRWKTI